MSSVSHGNIPLTASGCLKLESTVSKMVSQPVAPESPLSSDWSRTLSDAKDFADSCSSASSSNFATNVPKMDKSIQSLTSDIARITSDLTPKVG
ncbi:hypothetical protein [Acidithrix ferrooxidans]|uniref:Uncharacterized protein n=1 Tax=Acidithrix ferrooxidans TaxID=1280514 RepID=A0A0D8HI25_9ACTN|nr:hypothetical protein [Acidithrix ferrooxidans]KJF17504.1 hypothetical protein AXFE_16210 [Acidithrix ferrooxidans]